MTTMQAKPPLPPDTRTEVQRLMDEAAVEVKGMEGYDAKWSRLGRVFFACTKAIVASNQRRTMPEGTHLKGDKP